MQRHVSLQLRGGGGDTRIACARSLNILAETEANQLQRTKMFWCAEKSCGEENE